ncbi:hypothetical protein RHO13_00585 [Orbus wheelerorum]|uniref:hypothetical protein n=1 Tax=Orbus wheelerorum TaxID=3074111 RepID=UPI00370D4BCC
MTEKTKTKKSKFGFDENGGVIFMKNWPPMLRWISILPAILITSIVVRIIFFGPFLAMTEKQSVVVYIYATEIASALLFMLMVEVAAAVAPKGRVLTSIVTAVVLMIFVIPLTSITFYNLLNANYYIENKTHIIIATGLSIILKLFGVLLGISHTKDRQKYSPQAPQQTISNNIVS